MDILIIDDHQVVLDGISTILKKQKGIDSVIAVSNGTEGLKKIETGNFDLLLLDINMPEINGIDLCLKIKKKHPKMPILALSMHHEPAIIQRMMKAGANGYLLKDSGSDELLNAIKCIKRDGKYYSELVGKSMMKMWSGDKIFSKVPKLTRREKEVLGLILNEKTTEEIGKILHIQELSLIHI